MDTKHNDSFWPSYVDVMTTLFAIMLVLFAVSYSRFKTKETELRAQLAENQVLTRKYEGLVKEYQDILNVYRTINDIDSTRFFSYDAQYVKHLFTVDVEYQTKEYRLDRLMLDVTRPAAADEKRDSIVRAGELIRRTLISLEQRKSGALDNIKFLVVIEGQASRVPFREDDWRNNYTLSYLRAQFLAEFWKEHGIDFAQIPRCELIIAGSGEGGVPRIKPDPRWMQKDPDRWRKEESRNQRFLIHIVPVIGKIDV